MYVRHVPSVFLCAQARAQSYRALWKMYHKLVFGAHVTTDEVASEFYGALNFTGPGETYPIFTPLCPALSVPVIVVGCLLQVVGGPRMTLNFCISQRGTREGRHPRNREETNLANSGEIHIAAFEFYKSLYVTSSSFCDFLQL